MNKTNALVIMIGLSGSGKSYFAKQLSEAKNMKIYSSDDLRAELYGDAAIQSDHSKLFAELHKRMIKSLDNGESIIYDATNVRRKHRVAFINQMRAHVGYIEALVILTPYNKCIQYNSARDRVVPDYAIRHQLEGFNMPTIEEGFDSIQFIPNYLPEDVITKTEFINTIKDIPHDTPHHKSSIQIHSLRVMTEFMLAHPDASDVACEAALLHDIGKPMAKAWVKPNGEILDHAIYYNHDNIGSYLSMFVTGANEVSKWERALIIENHMKPYMVGAMEKMKKYLPQGVYDTILQINAIDSRRD